ncbi:SusC/RagA family TonB-linked outer membrane protein [Pontibacter sp. 172403-2]|uniref:SusC/RagA family TonB-linked outer membrane protein n=1 Tax=Pontibacter rufus TaxID=2791028 RepID=UPI0018B00A4E|nr:SusC/RagA family TonB-linked outer membrane protein [Pontibacter sp. 172403-2]MBF9255124.1 SusC/RagA family TonB-linked outer membrane protein [Pontibacter sp. 172403-2]
MKQPFTTLFDSGYVRGRGRMLCTGFLSFTMCAALTATQSHAAVKPPVEIPSMVPASGNGIAADYLSRYEIQVRGTVTDEKGMPLPGVTVVLKGTSLGVSTNADGAYELTIPDGQENGTLVFSYIGYKDQEVPIGNKTVIDVSLSTDAEALEEVVVVGYGTMQKKEVSSAITTVTADEFQQGAFNSPLQMIQGKVAGLTVSSTAAADPNASATAGIQIRGAGTILTNDGANSPLVVIDGMPNGDLRNLAQQDIASITVLKDAAASAIYGSRGANGVILVQTKRGKAGEVTVTYDSYVEHDVVAARPDILSPEEFLAHDRDQDFGARTDWYDELIREDNFGQNHNLAVSGGSENTQFRISGNYRAKTGLDIASDRKEYGLRASFFQRAMQGFLEVNGNMSYRVANEEYTNYGAFSQAVKLNPTIPIMDPNDPSMYNTLLGYDTYNPVQNLLARENGADQEYSVVDLTFRLNLLDNLNTEIKLARQGHDRLGREYYTSQAAESITSNRTGRARLENEKWTDYTFEWLGNYNTSIGEHNLTAMGGYTYQEFNYQDFWAENADFPSDAFGYNNLDAGSWNLEEGRLGMDSYREKEKVIAFLGRLNYNFKDTYFLTASYRYEGNTKFGANNKWGSFPSLSAAWRMSSLPAIEGIEAIDELKLRASYGVAGRSVFPRYTSLARYTGYGRYPNYDGEFIRVYGPANNLNPDLRWEKAISYDLGLDFTLFNNKVDGTFDLFDRRSKDLISSYTVPVPPKLHDQMIVNAGTMSSKGVELYVNWDAVETDDFTYSTNVTASYTKTRLVSWSKGPYTANFQDLQNLPSPGNPGPAYRLYEGTELGSFYGYKYAGVDADGNILIWKNGEEGGEKIDATTEGNIDRDRTFIGNGTPKYELSWGNRIAYKSFDLSLFFLGRFDYDVLNLYQMYYGLQAEPGVNLLEDAYTRNGQIKSGKVITDYFLESGNYFKLDNLTLGWTPKLGVERIKNFRIYGTVRNVFTLTNYSGLDPAAIGVTGLTAGYGSLDVYPIARNYALGVVISF